MSAKSKKKLITPIHFNPSLIKRSKKSISFEVPGKPFAKQRPRSSKRGTIYTPQETINYENLIKYSYYQAIGELKFDTAIAASIEGIFSPPKSISNKKKQQMLEGKIPHTKKPDCDNMAKSCLDALNGIAYNDDAQINKLTISKRYGENSKLIVKIEEN